MEIINSYYLLTKNKEDKIDIATKLSQFFTSIELEENVIHIPPKENDTYIPFEYEYKNVTYKFEILLASKNIVGNTDKDFYFEIKLFYKQKKSGIAALSNIIRELKKRFSKDCYFIVLEDSVSKYYNQLAYKYTSEYERKIRKLILVTLVPEFKENWVKQLSDYSTNLKGNSAVEVGLEELDLSHLEDILFAPKLIIDVENYNEIFETEKIKHMNKSELSKLIQRYAPKSFWDTYLSKYVPNSDLELKMKNIRNQRNKVAHHKYFTEEKYNQLKKDINYVNKVIDEAISLVISSDSRLDLTGMNENLTFALSDIIKSTTKYIEIMNKAVEIRNEAIAAASFMNSPEIKKAINLQKRLNKQLNNSLLNKDLLK